MWTTVILFSLGFIPGAALAFRGWVKSGGLVAVGGSVGTLAINFFRSAETSQNVVNAMAVIQDLRLDAHARVVATGVLVGLVATLLLAGSCVFIATLLRLRSLKRVDALPVAARRFTTLLGRGIWDYLARHPEAAHDAQAELTRRHLDYLQMQCQMLRKLASERPLSEQRCKDVMQQVGGLLLTIVFEEGPSLKDYRLAVFTVSDDRQQLDYYAVVNRGNWTAQQTDKPLPMAASFLGASINEGAALIYPRDRKGRAKHYQKRGKSRYKSFLSIPLPPDAAGPRCWGGITLDYIGFDEVFTQTRLEALSDFAQFADSLWKMKEEACVIPSQEEAAQIREMTKTAGESSETLSA